MPKAKEKEKAAFGCPHCGNTSGFREADIIEAYADVDSFDEKGKPVFGGNTEVDWNTQILNPTVSKYSCDSCHKPFDEPARIESRVSRKRKKK
jgi:hypothetical protein